MKSSHDVCEIRNLLPISALFSNYILNMSSPTPKLVNNEAKATIIQIRIANLPGDYEQTFKSK